MSSSIGGDYPYQDNIRSPSNLRMNDTGTIQQLGRNIERIKEYVYLLTSGKSKASATGGPLGNKYFLKTGATCKAVDTCVPDESGVAKCDETDRYIYINNVPDGKIGMGRGLIPGAIEKVSILNPSGIFRAFKDSSKPECQRITMQVIDNKNNSKPYSNYVTLGDIKDIDPCWFNTPEYNKTNPITKEKCKEKFQNPVGANAEVFMPDDTIDQLYFAGLAGIGIYIFYRIMEKAH